MFVFESTVDAKVAPCILHKVHAPIAIRNEKHFVFPVYLQDRLYEDVADARSARDPEWISVCATGHRNLHLAIDYFLEYFVWPDWCVAETRVWALVAVSRYFDAKAALSAPKEGPSADQ